MPALSCCPPKRSPLFPFRPLIFVPCAVYASIGLGSPPIYYAAKYMTENVFFKNPLIASGPCPACSAPNRLYFGDILGVEVSEPSHHSHPGRGREETKGPVA